MSVEINNSNTILLVSFFSARWLGPKLDGTDLQLHGNHSELGPSSGAKRTPLLPAHLTGGRHRSKHLQPKGSSCQQDHKAHHNWQHLPVHQTQEIFPLCADCYPSNYCWPCLQPYKHNVPENGWWQWVYSQIFTHAICLYAFVVALTCVRACFPLVPSSAPLLVSTRNLSSSSIGVVWQRPLEANGEITEYTLILVGPEGTDTTHTPNTSFVFTNLLPYTAYNLTITAATRKGSGPSLLLQLHSDESG